MAFPTFKLPQTGERGETLTRDEMLRIRALHESNKWWDGVGEDDNTVIARAEDYYDFLAGPDEVDDADEADLDAGYEELARDPERAQIYEELRAKRFGSGQRAALIDNVLAYIQNLILTDDNKDLTELVEYAVAETRREFVEGDSRFYPDPAPEDPDAEEWRVSDPHPTTVLHLPNGEDVEVEPGSVIPWEQVPAEARTEIIKTLNEVDDATDVEPVSTATQAIRRLFHDTPTIDHVGQEANCLTCGQPIVARDGGSTGWYWEHV